MESYGVRVTKDYLVFCSAHFITYHNDKCERIHGHNYKVAAEIFGPLNGDFLVVDFIDLKKLLRKITDELDHRVILPRFNKILKVAEDEREVTVSSGQKKRWVFPREDCAVLPIENTTAELLARWLSGRIEEELRQLGYPSPPRLIVEVEETCGQLARYEVNRGG